LLYGRFTEIKQVEITATKELDRYLETAFNAGCPEDQIRRFLSYGYIAQPKQLEFHAAARRCDLPGGIEEIGIGGARGGSKSHGSMAQIGMDDCQRQDDLKFLFLRKVQGSAKESFEDLIGRVFRHVPHEYTPSSHRVLFPNNSRIIFGGFKDERDIDKYLGIEYDGLVIEEATQISETKFDMIRGSIRTSSQTWRVRKYLSTNPGGIGHAWFKDRFVVPSLRKTATNTLFIPMSYKDNAYLSQDYVNYLLSLKGDLGRAWRDGDWDVFEGQAFPQWSNEDHVIRLRDFQGIPEHWMKWRAIDWGYAAPFSCHWVARDPDSRRLIVYREVYGKGMTVPQQARLINDSTPPNEHIQITYADPSMWASNSVHEVITTTAQEYANNGVFLTKADNNRLSGKRKVDELLAPLPDGLPGVQVVENCENLIRTIPLMICDEKNPEDINTTLEDHAYDSFRYSLTNIQPRPEPKPIRQRRSQIGEVF